MIVKAAVTPRAAGGLRRGVSCRFGSGGESRRRGIACECADQTCVHTIMISCEAYQAVRAEPRHFAVCTQHVYADVERVVSEHDGYVVVEKLDTAGDVAEEFARSAD